MPLPETPRFFETVLVDARSLQQDRHLYRPRDRQLLALVRNFPLAHREALRLVAYCRRQAPPLPSDIAELFDEVLGAPPYRTRNTLILAPYSPQHSFHAALAKPPESSCVLVVLIEDESQRQEFRREAPGIAPVFLLLGAPRPGSVEEADAPDPTVHLPPTVSAALYAETVELGPMESLLARRAAADGRPYLLVGAGMPADELPTVFEAAYAVRERTGQDLRVVLHGLLDAPSLGRVSALSERFHLQDQLTILPPLSTALQLHLSRAATAVVLRGGTAGSLAELETMAAGGVTVVGRMANESSASGMAETEFAVGDAGALADVLAYLLRDPARHEQTLRRQRAAAAAAREAPIIAGIWRQLFEMWRKTPDRANPPRGPARARPRIAFLSIYPPQEIGVPIYSRDTVKALAVHADVELWTEAAVTTADRRDLRSVRRLDERFDPLDYDQGIFVLGNHPLHRPVYDLLIKHRGAVVLHELQLFDFLHFTMGAGFRRHAAAILRRPVDEEELQRWFTDRSKMPEPFLETIVEQAAPPIVHSSKAQETLKIFYKAQSLYLPVAIQHPFAADDLSEERRAVAKLRCGVDPKNIAIGTFGDVQPAKGDRQYVFALRDLRDWGYDGHLYFVGVIAPELRFELKALAEKLDLAEAVHFTSRISESSYMEHLLAMDLAIQYRRMPFGQLSGALLDTVAAALPSVATLSLAEAIDAPDYVMRLEDVCSPFLMAEALADAIDSGWHRTRSHPSWRPYVNEHSFANYAERLISALLY